MTYVNIQVAMRGSVLELVLDRPQQLNALTPEMVAEMRDALQQVKPNGARAVLITANGKGFCAGADLASGVFSESQPGQGYGESVSRMLDEVFNPLVREMHGLSVPSVCALNGVAAGGGVGIALAADICIAGKSASFVQVFGPRLGIVPDAGASWFVARHLGRARTLGIAMLGDKISAEAAERWGLVWKCVEDSALLDEARAVADRLAAGPTRAFAQIRRLTDDALTNDLTSQLDAERDQQRVLCDSKDTVEGIAAFREKRPPIFRGS